MTIKTNRNEEELRALFDSRKPWLHMIYVNGVPTKTEPAWGEPIDNPRAKWERIQNCLDVEGKRVLDVGCNDGHYLFACRELGASSCVGIEASGHHHQNALLIKELLGFGDDVDVKNMSAYDIDESLGEFDVCLLLGLIYHLKNPLLVIEKVAQITTSTIVVETALRNSDVDLQNRQAGRQGAPSMDFVEQCYMPTSDTASVLTSKEKGVRYEGAPNWWVPNTACVCAMLRIAGFGKTEVVQERILSPSENPAGFGRGLVIGQKQGT